MAITTEASFRQFSLDLDAFGEKLLPEQFKIFQRKIAFEVLTRIVKRTPVDTGRARGNWQVTIGTFDTSPTDAIDKDGAGTIEKGLAVMASVGRGQTIFISNSVPYIIFLEEGSSRRAAEGMLAVSLAEVEMIFKVAA